MAANVLASETEADAFTHFGYCTLLPRVTPIMFQAIEVSLLPVLARLAAGRDYDDFRQRL